MLAATPLAGIVAKLAPNKDTCYLGKYAGHGLFNPAKAIDKKYLDKEYLAGMKNMPFAFWFDGPEVPRIGSTLNIRRPNRANIQS